METLFIKALLGHLIGDYLLQSKNMALQKSEPTWHGFKMCTIHVLLYTIAVCAMMQTTDPIIWLLVFIPHWIVDRWSLASYWLKLIRGRTFESAYNSNDKFREFDIAFTCIVYTVTDNTIHLLCLWGLII